MERELKVMNGNKLRESIEAHLNSCDGKMDSADNMIKALGINQQQLYKELLSMRKENILVKSDVNYILSPEASEGGYIDWNGNLNELRRFHKLRIPCLLIGPKGSGKSQCTQELSRIESKNLHTVNLSLRCRESHILGRLDVSENDGIKYVSWKKGPLPLSMEEGSILYLDELSAGEPDVLLRLDESLDSRRQLNFEGEEIIADSEWYCTASINPLSTPGTKQLPPQLISRFTARLYFDYPPIDNEIRIVSAHIKPNDRNTMYRLISLYQQIRKSPDIPYTPSIRESIVSCQLLNDGMDLNKVIECIAINPLLHWDDSNTKVIKDLVTSMGILSA